MTNWANPCERAAALRDAYYRLLSGEGETEIETRSADGAQVVKFARTNLEALRAEWLRAEDQCQQMNGQTPASRRSAISLGARRHRYL